MAPANKRPPTSSPPRGTQMFRAKISRTISIEYYGSTDKEEKYSEMEDVATNLQKVFFTGEHFVNRETLEYKTKDGSNVHMNLHHGSIRLIYVEVSWSRKSIPFFVCDSDTIGDLKTMLQEMEGTPPNQVTLIYNGEQLDDFDTFAPHNVHHKSIFYAALLGEEKIKIFIRMPGKETTPVKLDVKQCSSVENIKSIFHCMVGFPIDQQKLTFKGVLLENNRMLSDYKIKTESVLDMTYLAPGLMKIFVNNMELRTYDIFANSSDTINDVKKKIQYVTGVNHVQQMLIFGKQILVDGHTVGYYNIQKESTIRMRIRICGC